MSTPIPLLCAAFLFVGEPCDCAPFGYLNQPAYSIDKKPRLPVQPYQPQPGDVLLFSDPTIIWGLLYTIALTSAPGHSGLVVQLEDGQLGILEAGYDDKPWVRVVSLEQRLSQFPGTIWVRQRKTPITAEQSRILTWFANEIDGHRYGVFRLFCQLTVFRNRGPLRTYVLGKPQGVRKTYICSEAVMEALVAAALIDTETARPSATFPRDLFFDRSPNLYINRHPPLASDWEVPALWRATTTVEVQRRP